MNQDKKIYLITYSTDIYFNSNIVHQQINNLFNEGYIIDWWHYIDNTYLVACRLNVNVLYNLIYSYIKSNLLIVEIKAHNSQGWLPKEAWDWINKHRDTG